MHIRLSEVCGYGPDGPVKLCGFWCNGSMNSLRSPYPGYRFPPEIISCCVWLYFRFSVSYRDIEKLMTERGVQPVVRKPMIRYVRVPTSAKRTSAIVDRSRPKV